MVVFFIGNDLTNNNYRLELWDGNLRLALKPYFDVGNDGTLRLIPGPPPAPRAGFSNFLRGCCVLYNVVETGVYNKLDQNYPREQLEAIGGYSPGPQVCTTPSPGGSGRARGGSPSRCSHGCGTDRRSLARRW